MFLHFYCLKKYCCEYSYLWPLVQSSKLLAAPDSKGEEDWLLLENNQEETNYSSENQGEWQGPLVVPLC